MIVRDGVLDLRRNKHRRLVARAKHLTTQFRGVRAAAVRRNRHCPKCQTNARDQWLTARADELLPVPYFHVVFTLPHELSALALQNKRVLYELLFRISAETLLEVAADLHPLFSRSERYNPITGRVPADASGYFKRSYRKCPTHYTATPLLVLHFR